MQGIRYGVMVAYSILDLSYPFTPEPSGSMHEAALCITFAVVVVPQHFALTILLWIAGDPYSQKIKS